MGSSNPSRYRWILKPKIRLKNQRSGSKTVRSFSFILILKRKYVVLKSKSPWILLNKNINFKKNETESKMENPTHSSRRTLCFSSCKNRKLKVKLWWVAPRERKKRAFFALFILSKGNFLTFVFYYNV